MKLIDKDALLARIKKLKMDIGNIFNDYDEGFWEGRITAFDDVICALNTLEVNNDAFIEKAWDWIENNLLFSNQQDKSRLYFEQFKKYMKGE